MSEVIKDGLATLAFCLLAVELFTGAAFLQYVFGG